MPVTVVVGMQWGDEGKGKIVDYLAQDMDIVVRFNGGNNAGHTICNEYGTLALHLVPAGIFNKNCLCVIGNGVVIDLASLIAEIEALKKLGVEIGERLKINKRAHLIFPWHIMLDRQEEEFRGSAKLGTTLRGIGPAYTDKVWRRGIRVEDLLNFTTFKDKFIRQYQAQEALLKNLSSQDRLPPLRFLLSQYEIYREALLPYIVSDCEEYLWKAIDKKAKILLEGAQGALLDIDFGTYPYVTSCSTVTAAASLGSGIPIKAITRVIGVAKAYTTRIGTGPFPSEMKPDLAAYIRELGKEYGATTGRPRRCGWLDIKSLAFVARLNSIDEIALTKIDILSHLENILVCTDYDQSQNRIFRYFPGWQKSISKCKTYQSLPKPTRNFIRFIEESIKVPVSFISCGPARDQIIVRKTK